MSSTDSTVTIDFKSIKTVALKNFNDLHPEYINTKNWKSLEETFTELDTTMIIKDGKGRNAIYVFKYRNNRGWNIISGDKRFCPILAYNKEGEAKLDTSLNPGLKFWVDDIIQQINFMDNNGVKQSKEVLHEWEKYFKVQESSNILKQVPDDEGGGGGSSCIESNQVWANLNNSNIGFTGLNWNQTAGFNYYMPDDYCEPHSYYCNRFPSGCGPVAIGMIMRYYQKPANFTFYGTLRTIDYSIMPSTINPYNVTCSSPVKSQEETAALLRFVSGKYAEMWCFSISVPFYYSSKSATSLNPSKISQTFSDWGFTSPGNKIDYSTNHSRLISNLKLRKPVIFSGSSCDICLWDAHIWLCEGLAEYKTDLCLTYDYLYMNWGWGGLDNGWFGIYNSYAAIGVTFNNANMKIIVDINP